MKLAFILFVIWALGVSALLKPRFIRNRPDAYPLVAIWPVLLAYAIGILLFEGLRYLLRFARKRWGQA